VVLDEATLRSALSPALCERVAKAAAAPPGGEAGAVLAVLREELGAQLVALVFYGSRLNRTAGARSDWDFFVVVDDTRALRGLGVPAALHGWLPPTIVRRALPLADGVELRCKLCYVGARDLARFTSAGAPDSYLFGRLSKRVALVFARDAGASRALHDAFARSVLLCAAWTLAGAAAPLDAETLAREAVAFSYRCEERVEGPARPRALFEADAEHFRAVYAEAERALVAAGFATRDAGAVRRFVRRSRRRARLRWLKNVLTFEDWVDYMLTKIERHQDAPLVLTPLERRFPLLAAARHYLRMRREGKLSRAGA
jgi:hypothetical protein